MYFVNLVRLASYYLKQKIPLDKQILTTCIEQINIKNNPKNILSWMNIIDDTHTYFSQEFLPLIHILKHLLAANLSIDDWWSGVDYNILSTKSHLDTLIFIVNNTQNEVNISAEQALTEENYHILHQTLYNFAKALLNYLTKNHTHEIYTQAYFTMWLNIE